MRFDKTDEAIENLAVATKNSFDKVEGRLDVVEDKIDILDEKVETLDERQRGFNIEPIQDLTAKE